MVGSDSIWNTIEQALQALSIDSFPKKCEQCDRIYWTHQEYTRDVKNVLRIGSIKQPIHGMETSSHEHETDLYNMCWCGSKLVCYSEDFRTSHVAEERRRNRFGNLLELLVEQGIEANTARRELLKLMNGENSDIVQKKRFIDLQVGCK